MINMYILCCVCVFMYYGYPIILVKQNSLLDNKKTDINDTYILPALIVISVFWIIVLPIYYMAELFNNRKED